MDRRLIALKLILDHLETSLDITEFENRKLIQKFLYLVQVGGVDLGYRYNWDKKGPFSPTLAKGYHALDSALAAGDTEYSEKELLASIRISLDRIKALIGTPPTGLGLSNWLELLASIHYLEKVDGISKRETTEIIKSEKQEHSKYI